MLTTCHRATGLMMGLTLMLAACAARPRPPAEPATAVRHPPLAAPTPDPELEQLVFRLTAGKRNAMAARREIRDQGAKMIPYLLPLLERNNWRHRWEGANALGMIGSSDGIEPLARRCLEDSQPHVRWRSLWAIRECDRDGSDAKPIFLEALTQDPEHWRAAVALSFYGDPAGLDLVHEKLAGPSEPQRWEAMVALGQVHDERSSGYLEPILLNSSSKNRQEAMAVLGGICDARARELLAKGLTMSNPQLRLTAADAIGRCGATELLDALRQQRAVESNDKVVARIDAAIERIGLDNDRRQGAYREDGLDELKTLLQDLGSGQ